MRPKRIQEVLQKELNLSRENTKSSIVYLRNSLDMQQLFAYFDHLIQKQK